MGELFSRGSNGTVYTWDSRVYGKSPANLHKEVKFRRPTELAALIAESYGIEYKVAHLLFPENTIEVVDVVSFGSGGFSVFSVRASVPPDHATFTAHSWTDLNSVKWFTCHCENCASHKKFHYKEGLQEKALELGFEMREVGINTPTDDPTDYCLSGDEVIFFEVGQLGLEELTGYIEESGEDIASLDAILPLVERYRFLKDNHPEIFRW